MEHTERSSAYSISMITWLEYSHCPRGVPLLNFTLEMNSQPMIYSGELPRVSDTSLFHGKEKNPAGSFVDTERNTTFFLSRERITHFHSTFLTHCTVGENYGLRARQSVG